MKLIRNRPTRYPPDKNTLAIVHFGPQPQTIRKQKTGLVVDVSAAGCKILIVNDEPEKDGTAAFISIGEWEFTKARLKWSRELDRGIFLLGFELEDKPL
jgi:hypothetical protein